MTKLFGIDFPNVMAKALGSGLIDCTIHRQTVGDRDASDPGAGFDLTEDDITCKGVISSFNDNQVDGTLVQVDDRLVLVLAGTMSDTVEPLPTWGVTIEDTRYNIIRVRRDPAAATYQLQVRV